jgi:DNA helicase HerA-like ATPase
MPKQHPNETHQPTLTWYDVYPPAGLDLAALTQLIRPLASRPRLGLMRRTPIAVFELWSKGGRLAWLLGLDPHLASTVPAQLRAQLPGLTLVEMTDPSRPTPDLATTVYATGLVQPLRTEMASPISAGLLDTLRSLRKRESAVVQFVVGPAEERKVVPTPFDPRRALGLRPRPTPTTHEQNLWRQKAAEPLFAVRCRVGVAAATAQRAMAIIRLLVSSLQLANASHTELRPRTTTAAEARRLITVHTRGTRWSAVLNAAELAAILGWPIDGVMAPGVDRAAHPAPAALLASPRQRPDGVRLLGTSLHPADNGQVVTLPVATCLHHVHVTGVTGAGKSTLLAGFARADLTAGHGLLIVEPRGDLVQDVLAGVPPSRRDDVVVIEPRTSGWVVGINPLAGSRVDAERRADDVLHLFHELYPNVGPRSSDVLLHALIALARTHEGTLADLPILLTNSRFRRQILSEVSDPLVLAPFFAWYDGLSEAERSQVIAPVLNKTRAFLSRSAIRRLLGQARPRFHIDELLTQRKVVLVNLNAGLIGTETANLIGSLLMTQLWQAIQRRAAVPPSNRTPVMVVVDEVQNYLRLPVSIGDMLAQARGLGVSLTVAHQHLGQLTPTLRAAFGANARSKIALRPSSDDREPLARAFGGRLKAADFEALGAFEAYARLLVDGVMGPPLLVKTLPPEAGQSEAGVLRDRSLKLYGRDGAELDAQLRQRWYDQPKPDGSIGVRRRRAS